MLTAVTRLVSRAGNAAKATSPISHSKAPMTSLKQLKHVIHMRSIPTIISRISAIRGYTSASQNFMAQALQTGPVPAPRVAFSTKKRVALDYWPFELEESDFLRSDNEPNPIVLQDDPVPDPSPAMVSIPTLVPLSVAESDVGLEEGSNEPKTFEELFSAAYADHLSETGSSDTEELERWHVNARIRRIAEKSVEKGGLHHAESVFANLFQKQSKWQGGESLMLHKVSREGWRSMLNGYVLQGTEKQLEWFMDTYSAMYGLHELDRTLCTIKFHLCHNELSGAQRVWDQAIEDGLTDDRGFSLMAKGYSLLSDYKMACQILDDAWMKALADNNFKITSVFYQTSAEIFIAALDVPRLTDLFIRLHANKPRLDSRFFTVLFRTLNSLTGISSRISNAALNPDSPTPTYDKATLSKVFDMIEACLSKSSIQPTTQLRNEMIAFKLYTESDFSKMFQLVSQYATSPDSRTLNMMLDALIHEGKMPMASLLCDSWDAQFGVKMDVNSHIIISNNLIEFCKLPIPETITLGSSNTENTQKSFSSIYSLHLPVMSLFDELVLRKPLVELTDHALIAFTEYVAKLERPFSKPSPGTSLLASYVVSRHYDAETTSTHRFYGVAQALFNNQNAITAKQICDFAGTVFSSSKKMTHIRSLAFQWSHTYEPLESTQARWNVWVSQKSAISSTIATGYLRAISRHPFTSIHSEFLSNVLAGKVTMTPTLLGALLRLMIKQPPETREPTTLFALYRIIQRQNVTLNSNLTSMASLILLIDSKRTLTQAKHKSVEKKLKPFRNSEPATKYPLPLSDTEAEQFQDVLQHIEQLMTAST